MGQTGWICGIRMDTSWNNVVDLDMRDCDTCYYGDHGRCLECWKVVIVFRQLLVCITDNGDWFMADDGFVQRGLAYVGIVYEQSRLIV